MVTYVIRYWKNKYNKVIVEKDIFYIARYYNVQTFQKGIKKHLKIEMPVAVFTKCYIRVCFEQQIIFKHTLMPIMDVRIKYF